MVWSAALAVVTLILAIVVLRLLQRDLDIPQGLVGDFTSAALIVKGMTENGWFLENANLGWPLHLQLYDYPIGDNNLNLLLMRAIALFTSDFATVINLYILLTYPITAVCAFVATRRLGATRPSAALVGLLYAFLNYHLRGQVILLLMGFYALPFAILLAIRVFQGTALFERRPGGSGVRGWMSRRTIATLATALAIGSTGLYFAAFALVLLATAAIVSLFVRSGRRAGVSGLVACGAVLTVVALNNLPSLLHRASNGVNEIATARGPGESELYGLTLTRLVFPPQTHRVGFARDLAERYEAGTKLPLASEQSAYLGIVSVVGLCALFVFMLAAAAGSMSLASRRRYGPLAACAVTAFVYATVGGANSIVSFTLTPALRGLGRISTVIAFCTLAAVALGLDAAARALRRRDAPKWIAPAAIAWIAALGVYDQTATGYTAAHYDAVERQWNTDERFVTQIEAAAPQGTAIYTMPEQIFLGGGGPGSLFEYDAAQGYLHTDRFKWSYGAIGGREGRWLLTMRSFALEDKLQRVSACGFGGLWVDRNGYDSAAAADAEQAALSRLLRVTSPIVSGDGRRLYYSLADWNRREGTRIGAAARAELCERSLRPLYVEEGPGLGTAQTDGVTNWRWAARESTIGVHNDLADGRRLILSVTAAANQPTRVTVTGPDGRTGTAVVGTAAAVVGLETTLAAGDNEITMRAEAVDGSPLPDGPQVLRVDRIDLGDPGRS